MKEKVVNFRLKNGRTETGKLQREMKTAEMRDLRPDENLKRAK
jgi:hypothetical protein